MSDYAPGSSSTSKLVESTRELVDAALEPSSRKAYDKAFHNFSSFQTATIGLPSPCFPATIADILLYISHLRDKNLSPNTIVSEISKLSYFHKLAGHFDPTNAFIVKKQLIGVHKLNPSADSRLPITVGVLLKLVRALELTLSNSYTMSLFRAMYLTAFHGFLCIGEMTARGSGAPNPSLSRENVKFFLNHDGEQSVELVISNYKHNTKGSPFSIVIGPQRNPLCGVSALDHYIKLRGDTPGPLFCHPNFTPIHRDVFNKQLTRDLRFCHLDPTRFKGHSFRIGAASLAVQNNLSDAQIRRLGRWNSDSFKKYIRTPTLWSSQATGQFE
ncbi:uncharacterized protein LOC106158895 [Lingula anatina]|uniref:Uncharacterized protein LOC106158895 n=1 Tax=Lingula anatina TaxID=7574 RepID=A0A1S3HY27_LINAN|nr:uncharacterized protein LOC106158895 [Lingula anatina]|eukprot:XP_013390466.1 uncharacterized protein LOC106158895 [Lingula anatina]